MNRAIIKIRGFLRPHLKRIPNDSPSRMITMRSHPWLPHSWLPHPCLTMTIATTPMTTTSMAITPMPGHDYPYSCDRTPAWPWLPYPCDHTHDYHTRAWHTLLYTLHQDGKLLNHTPTFDKLPNHTPFLGEGYDSVVWGMKM